MNVIVNNTKLEADGKFSHPDVTAKGEKRARVGLTKLETLWFNTGTLCNLACVNTQEIGITGGEPFMNPDILKIMETSLKRGFKLLVLTNAMRPMMKCAEGLLKLNENYGEQMTLRVSVDHFKPELHEEERGANSWEPMMKGLQWLSENKFHIDVAGRTRWGEEEQELRDGFDRFFRNYDRLLGHIKCEPCRYDVFVIAYGRQTQGRRKTVCSGLHATCL